MQCAHLKSQCWSESWPYQFQSSNLFNFFVIATLKFHLFESQREKDLPYAGTHPQRPQGPGLCHTESRVPGFFQTHVCAGAESLGHRSPKTLSGTGSEVVQQQVSMWDASIIGRCLIYCATILNLNPFYY